MKDAVVAVLDKCSTGDGPSAQDRVGSGWIRRPSGGWRAGDVRLFINQEVWQGEAGQRRRHAIPEVGFAQRESVRPEVAKRSVGNKWVLEEVGSWFS